jgi:AcrR family transcriptional regulator
MAIRKTPDRDETLVADGAQRQTQAERREAAERAILDAAVSIVAERGVEELTLNAAGEAAGYSRALPTHYFGTKGALLHSLADHIVATYNERVRAAPLREAPLDRLCDLISFCIDDAIRDPTSVRAYQSIIAAGLNHPELRPVVDRMTRTSIEDLAAVVREGRDKGHIRADARPRAEAAVILASLRGVLFQWLIIPDHVPLLRVRDSLVASIRLSLAA